jgi:hypothetical protein
MISPLTFDEKFDFLTQCFQIINNAIELFTEINHEEGELQCKKIRGSFNIYKDQLYKESNNILRSDYSSLLEDDNSILLGKVSLYFVEVILSDETEKKSSDK